MIYINVLNLFDGMSCCQIALDRAGIYVNTYYASEIDPHSIKITQKNYPNTIQLGDVTKLRGKELAKIGGVDFLSGGSPCNNLSRTVINNSEHNQGLKGEKSKLFDEYVRIKNEVSPTYFLYENVASMKNEDRDVITDRLQVEPIMMDSTLLTAQDRKRYYWTNIPNVMQPEDKGIVLKDIMMDEVDETYYYDQTFYFHGWDKKVIATLHVKGHDILKRIYNPNDKCGTLTACRGGYKQKKVYHNGRARKLTPLEYERLQTVPEGYTEGVADGHRYNMLGDGWTVDVIVHILQGLKNT